MGKYKNSKGGHGFAAEDVNAQIDRWHGKKWNVLDVTMHLTEQIELLTDSRYRPNTASRQEKLLMLLLTDNQRCIAMMV